MNPSRPFSRIVSVNALSVRHSGQVLVSPSGPPYHWLIHSSQPMMLLQHLARMTGGFIGRTWHMVHLKEPRISFCSPSGRLVAESVVRDFSSSMSSLIV